MTGHDKYGIRETIERHFNNQDVLDMCDRYYAQKCVSAIWEDVYLGMPLKDTDDRSIEVLLEKIKELTGEDSLKVDTSCGLFSQHKLTLANGVWYFERSQGGYYILPVLRSGRRFQTRLDAGLAADLIITFDRHIPEILSLAEEKKRQARESAMTAEIIRTTAIGIIHSLISEGRIKTPGEAEVKGGAAKKVCITFKGVSGFMKCPLELLETRLIKKYGI